MKKIISIFCIFMLFSCDKICEEDTVLKVTEFKKGRFEIETTYYSFYTDFNYKIGDTLKITKK